MLRSCVILARQAGRPFFSLDPALLDPVLRILFQVPYPVSPVIASLMRSLHPGRLCGTKSTGVYPNNSHCGTRHSARATLRNSFCFRPSALFCAREKLNSFVFKRFGTLCTNAPGVG